MDPYYNSRGTRPDSFGQSGYSFMNNILEQSVFSDEPFHHGLRINFPVNNGNTFYNQDMVNESSVGIHMGNVTGHLRYDPGLTPALSPTQYDKRQSEVYGSSNESVSFTRGLNQDGKITNSFEHSDNSENNRMVANNLSVSVSPRSTSEVTICGISPEQSMGNDSKCQSIIKPNDINDTKIVNDYDAMEKEHVLTIESKNYDSCNDSALVHDQQYDTDTKHYLDSETAKQNDSAEKAVDLSKQSVANESEKDNFNETIASNVKEENFDSDDDKTIVDEPVTKPSKVFKCKECEKIYHCESSMKKHQNIHSRTFTCKICDKSWNSKYALTQHEKVHSGEREGNLCNICGKTFFDSSSLNKHTKSVHVGIKTFACDRCDRSFYARKTLDEHIRVHTGERPFKCKICPKTYKRISDLNHHIRGHTGETKHVCEVCGKGLRRLSELKVHMNQHKGDIMRVKKSDIVCNWCSKVFKSQNDLNDHTSKHFENVVHKRFNKDEHDSAFIAAAINSALPEFSKDAFQIPAQIRDETHTSEERSNTETSDFHKRMQQLYQHAGVKPSKDYSCGFETSVHQPTSKVNCSPGTEPCNINKNQSLQDASFKRVDNWLNSHFTSTLDSLQNNASGNTDRFRQESVDKGNNLSTITSSDNPDMKSSNLKLNSINSGISEHESSEVKPNMVEEKQKNIATVIDYLAEKKAKDLIDLEAKTSEDLEIKHNYSDGGETDDYDINNYNELEETDIIEISKKTVKKEKSGKTQKRKESLKITLKLKQSGIKKRQRKQRPKRWPKGSPKSSQKVKEDEKSLDTESPNEVDTEKADDFPVQEVMKDGLYFCAECEKTFKRSASFRKHQEMHNGFYTCTQCNKSLSSSWSLKSHMQIHSNADDRTRYPCNVCAKSFCDKSSLHKHVKSVHMAYKPFKCSECERAFSERKTLEEHVRTHTGERPFLCTFCPKTFKRISELNHHIRWHTGEVKHTCDTCGRGFRRMSELLRHVTLHTDEKPFQCRCCGKGFRSFSVMREHELRHLGQSKYACERCGKKYYKKTHLERHLESAKECMSCKYCLIPFEDPFERQKHEESHTGELKYSCTICGKRFRGRGPLNKHLRIHSQDRHYVCDQCGASFIQSNHLKQHVRTHTGEKPYSCLICGKSFAQSGTLYSHMKTHVTDGTSVQGVGGYHYYDSENSENNEIHGLGEFKESIKMIEAKM